MRRTGSLQLDSVAQASYHAPIQWATQHRRLTQRINYLQSEIPYWAKIIAFRKLGGRPTGALEKLLQVYLVELEYKKHQLATLV
jgi:hypothetical protein